MRPIILTILFAGLLLGARTWTGGATAAAQEMEVVAGGELEYQNYCAVCHGVDAKGQGIMSKFLNVRPADLTQLAKKSGGTFPFWQVYRVIDGRQEISGHGTRDMPIWGDRFRAQAGGNDPGSRAQAAGRLLGLVFYLRHIQE
ncbi:MAG TPA: c-type cytochrome [Candidatus Binatia bacterium]|jgi:mono/diheme cytochrome c family protein